MQREGEKPPLMRRRKVGRLATAVTRPGTRPHTSVLYIRQLVRVVQRGSASGPFNEVASLVERTWTWPALPPTSSSGTACAWTKSSFSHGQWPWLERPLQQACLPASPVLPRPSVPSPCVSSLCTPCGIKLFSGYMLFFHSAERTVSFRRSSIDQHSRRFCIGSIVLRRSMVINIEDDCPLSSV